MLNVNLRFSVFILIFCVATAAAWSVQHDITTINVEVPVRVFDGDTFVPDLTLSDFELYENGVRQDIQALYLVKNSFIQRRDGEVDFMPYVGKHYFFLFQMHEYDPKIEPLIDYFMNQVYRPEDSLHITTPGNSYNLKREVIESKKRSEIAADIKMVIKRDTQTGTALMKEMIRDLRQLVSSMRGYDRGSVPIRDIDTEYTSVNSTGNIPMLLVRYKDQLTKLDSLSPVKGDYFLEFARRLKRVAGEKVVFFFYQKEFKPELSGSIISRIQFSEELQGQIDDVFQFSHREFYSNIQVLKQVFSDSSLIFNLIFFNKQPKQYSGIVMREQSEDVFDTLSQLAEATGGMVDTSSNPDVAFKNTVSRLDSHYLLYYQPKNYREDGTFHTITVKTKDNFKVIHRQGYYATK